MSGLGEFPKGPLHFPPPGPQAPIMIAEPQWGLRPCAICGKTCAGTWCSGECWDKAKLAVEDGPPVLQGPPPSATLQLLHGMLGFAESNGPSDRVHHHNDQGGT